MYQSTQPKKQKKLYPMKQVEMRKANSEEIGSMSTNTLRHKMPEIILNYIAEKAKLRNEQNQLPKTNKFSRMAAKLTMSKKLSGKFNREKCPICESEVANNEMVSLAECGHRYCSSCLHQYVIYKIGVFENVECPNEECHQILDEKSKLYSEIPLDARKKYKKIKQYQMSLKNPNQRLCPNEHCDGFLQMPSSRENEVVIANPKCNSCNKIYCSKCFFEEHSGDCDPHQLNFFQDTLHYRQCSRCKNIIEKSSGCNHMTCRCGYQFCYVCGGKWRHSHLCNNPDGQPIYNDPDVECLCCRCDCCECCDDCECCEECCDNCAIRCEECCCENCCEPFCERFGQCCETLCCGCECCEAECECCESECCLCFGKIMFVMAWVIFICPFYYLWFSIVVLMQVIGGIFFGLCAGPCLICDEDEGFDLESWQIVLAIILLPITIIFLMGFGVKMLLCEFNEDFCEMACVPCQILSNCMNDQF